MPVWIGYALVFVGGGIGAAARHGSNRAAAALVGTNYPWATLVVNVVGCLVMGMLTSWFAFRGETAPGPLRLLLTTGVLGGFTTFSAFALDTVLLFERHDTMAGLLYVVASVLISIVAVMCGMWLVRLGLA